MLKIKSLDHLVLTVKDVNQTTSFYCDVLGMDKVIFENGRIGLLFGDQKINIHELGNELSPKAKNPQPGSADLCFLSDHAIEKWIIWLNQNGVSVIEGPIKRTGAKNLINSIYVRDPDSNLIEISNKISMHPIG